MSISSSLYAGISGLSTMGNAMSVIGDNISNVNTVAFKSSRATFQDVLSQQISTASGSSQVGRGVTLASVGGLFAQGSFESSSQPTDLAIGGNGFFVVRAPGTENNLYYTRAGEFRFDQSGYLVNPAGYVVQGWELDQDTGEVTGTIGDILVPKSSAPVATDSIEVISNLDSRETESSANDLYDPLLAFVNSDWDGTGDPPISANSYAYHSAIQVYDSLGNSHDITLYFDPTATANEWEYLVTCNPDEDLRTGAATNEWAGALLYGTIEFNTSGDITDITANTVDASDGSLDALTAGTDTPNGYFQFAANFTGAATDQTVDLNFGSIYTTAWEKEALTSSQYASASTTIFQDQDGFGAGFLQSVSVSAEGIITGHYSNGQIIPRNLIGLADFNNLIGLSKVGGNLFSETTESGAPITGQPGTNGLGSIAPNSLEQSNVDLGAEFVRMITVQRGFQANSKIITTTDDMLAELISLKR
ncbi:MAG: flagellar hook protein FlgE [Thermodesulfobacteriota bacterium]